MAATKTAKRYIEVMFKSGRLLREQMKYSSDLSHLSILQIHTLSFLKEKSNASMGEIAEHFHIELPSATSLLNKLVALHLVKRLPDEKDRRLVKVALTDEGNNILKNAMEEKLIHVKKMLSYLSEDEQNELLRLLEKLNDRIEKKYER